MSGEPGAAIRLAHAEIASGGGALATAAGNANRTWNERRGLLVRLVADGGPIGLGEASPLSGYSPDTLAEARDDLLEFVERAAGQTLALDEPIRPQVLALLAAATSPAARFAIETALLDLAGQRLGRSVARLYAETTAESDAPTARAATCSLIAPGDTDGARRATTAALKLKIGRAASDAPAAWQRELDDVARVIEARREQGEARPVRVDVNGRWALDIAAARCEQLAALGVEFIEQPVAPADMPALLGGLGTDVPIGLDESLHRITDDEADALFGAPACRYAILKPMVLGGGYRCADLAARGQRFGVEPVASHLFDGPIAMAAYCELALHWSSSTAAGLSHHAGLDAWSLPAPAQLGSRTIAPAGSSGLGYPSATISLSGSDSVSASDSAPASEAEPESSR